jgi:hypothetical protein
MILLKIRRFRSVGIHRAQNVSIFVVYQWGLEHSFSLRGTTRQSSNKIMECSTGIVLIEMIQ